MAKSREVYLITGNDLESIKRQLNTLLSRFVDRLDKLEGLRGELETESGTFGGDITANADLVVNDDDGNVIHALE